MSETLYVVSTTTTLDSGSHFLCTSDDFEMLCKEDKFFTDTINSCVIDQMNIFIGTTKTFLLVQLASIGHSINYELGIKNAFYSTMTFIWVHCFIQNIIHSHYFSNTFTTWWSYNFKWEIFTLRTWKIYKWVFLKTSGCCFIIRNDILNFIIHSLVYHSKFSLFNGLLYFVLVIK